MPNNFCYYTWKHNPITSNLMKLYLRKVDKDIELLIFVATTGRSATTTLSEIFERIPGCSSHHEPNPNMNGQIMINPFSPCSFVLTYTNIISTGCNVVEW